jgi:hypothetical protein
MKRQSQHFRRKPCHTRSVCLTRFMKVGLFHDDTILSLKYELTFHRGAILAPRILVSNGVLSIYSS